MLKETTERSVLATSRLHNRLLEMIKPGRLSLGSSIMPMMQLLLRRRQSVKGYFEFLRDLQQQENPSQDHTYNHTFTLLRNQGSTVNPTCFCFDHPEKIHASTVRTLKIQMERPGPGFELRTLKSLRHYLVVFFCIIFLCKSQ